jgi:hypothetical protein
VNKYFFKNLINQKVFFNISARDEEPLDPSFVQFPQSVTLEEGGKGKFNCKLSGSTPMTGKKRNKSKIFFSKKKLFL